MTPAQTFREGVRDSATLGIAAASFGLLFGIAAVAAGLAEVTAIALSATVLAGSAQFAALALWQSPLPYLTIAVTVALVGARHVLMGITLKPIVATAPPWQRWVAVAFLTDFNWALTVTGPPEKQRFAYFLGSGLTLYMLWTMGTVVGAFLPGLLDEATRSASAAAGTLFLAGIATVLVKTTGRPALLPITAAGAAAWFADASFGATTAPAAAIIGGALIYGGRALVR